MSEEIKKETQDVELNPEEPDKVSGGYTEYRPGALFNFRFIFTEQEVQIIQRLLNVTLEAGRGYTAPSLKILASEKAPRIPSEDFCGTPSVFLSRNMPALLS